MVDIIANSFADMAIKAKEACEYGVVTNLCIKGVFGLEEINSEFIRNNIDTASLWQQKSRPPELLINHGEFIHKMGDGIEYLIDELKQKHDSNRACLSLIDMDDIYNSGDSPIPSFLVFQCGFSDSDNSILIITCYFRALEVSCFLPSNLAEVAIIVQNIQDKFAQITTLDVTIHAFRAHSIPRFYCLKKALIDAIPPTMIGIRVAENNKAEIRKWLDSKIAYDESVVCTTGLSHLVEAVRTYSDRFEKLFLINLEMALDLMVKLEQTRKTSSHSSKIQELGKKIRDKLEKAREIID